MEKNYLVGKCTKCGYQLRFEEKDTSVQCPCCDAWSNTSELISNRNQSLNNAVATFSQAPVSFGTSEATLAYVENYFQGYDWDEFAYNSALSIDAVDKAVEDAKVKYANVPETWLLAFNALYVPVDKKIKGLDLIGKEIARLYMKDDGTDAYSLFDEYKNIIRNLIASHKSIINALELNIEYATKYKLQAQLVTDMKTNLKKLESDLSSLKECDSISDVPGVQEAISSNDAEIEKYYKENGIVAKDVYKKAVATYNFDDDKSTSLMLFNRIYKYKDSAKYIKKINKFFHFNNLYVINDRYFLINKTKEENVEQNPTMAADAKKTPSVALPSMLPVNLGYEIYEIIDGVQTEKPLIKNVIDILSVYGSKLFMITFNRKDHRYQLGFYDLSEDSYTALDSCSSLLNDYEYKKIFFTDRGDKFFIKKKLTIKEQKQEKKGCASIFKKEKNIQNSNDVKLNNYSILLVDMLSQECETIIKAAVDIFDCFNDKIFYSYAFQEKKSETQTKFLMFDLNTNSSKEILDPNYFLETVVGNDIIYTTFNQSKNALNRDLHIFNLETSKDVILEKNIYEFYRVIDDRIYYKVGNELDSTLFSIKFDGTERTQILTNAQSVEPFIVRSGWIYLIKATRNSYNSVLFKISLDGKKKVVLGHEFYKAIKIIDGNLYYENYYGDLYSVRLDGTNDRLILDEVYSENEYIINGTNIYFTKEEVKEYKDNNASSPIYTNSFYSTNIYGQNIIKYEFDVDDIKEYDENYIYIYKEVKTLFDIITPNDTPYCDYFNLKKYYKFDVNTHETEEVVVLGKPTPKSQEIKSGCLKKTKTISTTYTEVPLTYERVRRDVKRVGENMLNNIKANQQNTNTNKLTNSLRDAIPQKGCLRK